MATMAPLACRDDNPIPLCYSRTRRFGVIERLDAVGDSTDITISTSLPILDLLDLLLHDRRQTTQSVKELLWEGLRNEGYCFLVSPKRSQPSKIIQKLRRSLHTDLFRVDAEQKNATGLETSDRVYVSEKGIPMYRLGYELCEDGVRQVFRIAAGSPDDQPWPNCPNTRETWLRSLGLMRHICDTALDLLLVVDSTGRCRKKRPGSGSTAWQKDFYSQSSVGGLPERHGDLSVVYAMHYFNEHRLQGEANVTVKAHVDPSILVLEPFLCPHTTGLQVWDRSKSSWMDCDGPTSPAASLWPDHEVMLLFVGKALGEACNLEPTRHRVVMGDDPRCTVIYEQKYQEFFPPPDFD
jgi:hypothetical protein